MPPYCGVGVGAGAGDGAGDGVGAGAGAGVDLAQLLITRPIVSITINEIKSNFFHFSSS